MIFLVESCILLILIRNFAAGATPGAGEVKAGTEQRFVLFVTSRSFLAYSELDKGSRIENTGSVYLGHVHHAHPLPRQTQPEALGGLEGQG